MRCDTRRPTSCACSPNSNFNWSWTLFSWRTLWRRKSLTVAIHLCSQAAKVLTKQLKNELLLLNQSQSKTDRYIRERELPVTLYLYKLRAVTRAKSPSSSSSSILTTEPTVVCAKIKSTKAIKSHSWSSRQVCSKVLATRKSLGLGSKNEKSAWTTP